MVKLRKNWDPNGDYLIHDMFVKKFATKKQSKHIGRSFAKIRDRKSTKTHY